MRRMIANIFWLGTKELRAFGHDLVLVALVVWAFSFSIISRHEAACRSCTTPRSASLTRINRFCRVVSPRPFCRLYFKAPQPIAGPTSNA